VGVEGAGGIFDDVGSDDRHGFAGSVIGTDRGVYWVSFPRMDGVEGCTKKGLVSSEGDTGLSKNGSKPEVRDREADAGAEAPSTTISVSPSIATAS
jgi:hypothetical protein